MRTLVVLMIIIQFIPISLISQNSPAKAFNENDVIRHYWYYRNRLKYFVQPGTNIGEGQMVGIRNSIFGEIDPYNLNNTHENIKNVSWGQHNVYFGCYLGVLATEYYLLGQAGESNQQANTLIEINLVLDQWTNYLDMCEKAHYGKDEDKADGFFIRTDVDPDNFFNSNSTFGNKHLASFNEGLDKDLDVFNPTTIRFGSLPLGYPGYADKVVGWQVPTWVNKQNYIEPMSSDESIGLLLGLSLVYNYTGGDTRANAKGIAYRVVNYIANHHDFDCWWIYDPNQNKVGEYEGGDATLLSGGFGLFMQDFFGYSLTSFISPWRIPSATEQWNVYQTIPFSTESDAGNASMYATLAALGNSWAVFYPFPFPHWVNKTYQGIETTTSGYGWTPFYELLYKCLYINEDIPSNDLERYRSEAKLWLSELPDEGPYYYNDETHAGGGWACTNSWHHSSYVQTYGDQSFSGNYDGLDIMLLINLHLITELNFGPGINLINYHPYVDAHLAEVYPIKIDDKIILGTNALPVKNIYFKTITSGSKIQANTNYYLSNGQPVPLIPPINGISGNVSYLAGEKIILNPGKSHAGFTVEKGARFIAKIKKPLIFYQTDFSENSDSYLRNFLMLKNSEKITSSDLNNTNNSFATDSISDINSSKNIIMYPNPTSGNLKIRISGELKDNTDVIITDFNGNVIQNISNFGNETNIDISSEKSGIYLIRIISDHYCKVLKLIKL